MNDAKRAAEATQLEVRAASKADTSRQPIARLKRAVGVLGHYSWRQIARRGWSQLRRQIADERVIDVPPAPAGLRLEIPDAAREVARIVVDDWSGSKYFYRGDLSSGRLMLLNREAELGWPINWMRNLDDLPHLWRFQLHYHEYLLAWVAAGDADREMRWQTVWNALASWIASHSPDQTRQSADAWHPYCISRRLAVWFWLLALDRPPGRDESAIVASIWQQAGYLQRNLERDVSGNHLMENLTVLVLAASFLECEESEKWFATAERFLDKELERQILPHGEHFERSPMYHCQVLANVLKMAVVARRFDPRFRERWLDTARSMIGFLAAIKTPGGEIPLLGDSVLGEAPTTRQIEQLARLAKIESIEPTPGVSERGGYWVFRRDGAEPSEFLLFDREAVCADTLPAHGHCDLLNVTGDIGGRPWLIDSGNFDYEASTMRQYCRSSIAHNVATVDGENQCAIWSRFRMGRRGRVISRSGGEGNGLVWATAAHDGYRSYRVARLNRLVAAASDGGCWICVDWAESAADTSLTGFLHLSPAIQVTCDEANSSPFTFSLGDGIVEARITFVGVRSVTRRAGWYCPAFGIREPAMVFEYEEGPERKALPGWILQWRAVPLEVSELGERLGTLLPELAKLFNWKTQ